MIGFYAKHQGYPLFEIRKFAEFSLISLSANENLARYSSSQAEQIFLEARQAKIRSRWVWVADQVNANTTMMIRGYEMSAVPMFRDGLSCRPTTARRTNERRSSHAERRGPHQ